MIFAISAVGAFAQSPASSGGELTDARRAELERQLAELESQMGIQQQLVDTKQREAVSLERDIAILEANIRKAQLSIQARNLAIKNLSQNIEGKETTIGDLVEKLDREKESLAQLIRKTNEVDEYSLVEVVLSNKNFSDFFADLDSFQSIKSALGESFAVIAATKALAEGEIQSLEEKQAEELELRRVQELEQRKVKDKEKEKNSILKETRGEEARYRSILKAQQKTAAEIRAELFRLRGTAAIPFGRAYELAEKASAQTGIRPAFLLGIIAEESNLGENVGTGNWLEDMHPTRDRPVFEEITRRLGLDPNSVPVSKKPWYGWGGAMGPAQFIPSTWVLYEDRVGQLTGHVPPSPWEPEDAFMASSLLLADNGAGAGTRAAERLAALRYLAGWKNAEKPEYAFYGDDVMDLAAKYQAQIDILKGL
jgi:hypothetical protein